MPEEKVKVFTTKGKELAPCYKERAASLVKKGKGFFNSDGALVLYEKKQGGAK
jgi:hypothetical protein